MGCNKNNININNSSNNEYKDDKDDDDDSNNNNDSNNNDNCNSNTFVVFDQLSNLGGRHGLARNRSDTRAGQSAISGDSTPRASSGDGLDAGVIAGGVVGGLLFPALLAAGVVYWTRRAPHPSRPNRVGNKRTSTDIYETKQEVGLYPNPMYSSA